MEMCIPYLVWCDLSLEHKQRLYCTVFSLGIFSYLCPQILQIDYRVRRGIHYPLLSLLYKHRLCYIMCFTKTVFSHEGNSLSFTYCFIFQNQFELFIVFFLPATTVQCWQFFSTTCSMQMFTNNIFGIQVGESQGKIFCHEVFI